MSRRNQSGRFAGSSSRESFDLVRSLRALFRAAEKGGDYAGAASIARVLRDLDPGPAQATSEDPVRFREWGEQLLRTKRKALHAARGGRLTVAVPESARPSPTWPIVVQI